MEPKVVPSKLVSNHQFVFYCQPTFGYVILHKSKGWKPLVVKIVDSSLIFPIWSFMHNVTNHVHGPCFPTNQNQTTNAWTLDFILNIAIVNCFIGFVELTWRKKRNTFVACDNCRLLQVCKDIGGLGDGV
jgi:hypothetical protein